MALLSYLDATKLIVLLFVVLLVTFLRGMLSGRGKLPPGPSGLPVVGNLLQIKRVSGDAGQRANYEIIAKRASITGERPYFPISGGLVSNDKRTVLRQTKEWTDGRRAMHHLLSGTALREYGKSQETESVHLLANYLKRPEQWYLHHYRYAYSIAHRVVLGERPMWTQKQLDDFQRVTVEFVQSIFKSPLEFFPVLCRLPSILQPWRHHWEAMGRDHHSVFKAWWSPVKHDIATNTAPPSFVRDVLLHSSKFAHDDDEAMYLATSVVAAGSDNVRMTINAFVMAVLCCPSAMQRARSQLDGVCHDRLPTLADMPALPYISALVKEVLRWRPTVPLIPPHHLTQDLEFEGYRFPAGTDFVVNSFAVCQEFEDAAEFRPERWLDGKEDVVTHGLWQFGGGRRVCVGYKIAQQELFLAYSRLIHCFDLAANGEIDSRNLRPNAPDEPFPVKITVRSKAHEDLILKMAQEIGA